MKTTELIKKYRHLFNTDYTQDANCVGAWLMDIDEDPLTDSSGNNNTAALDSPGHPDFIAAAKFGGGYYFTSDEITMVNTMEFGDNCSLVMWLNMDDNTVNEQMPIGDDTNDDFVNLITGARIQLQDDTPQNINFDCDFIAEWPETWMHFCIVDNGTNYLLYVDGVLEDTQVAPGIFHINTIGHGYSSESYYFIGEIDESALFTRALDATEINDIMDNSLTGPGIDPYPTRRLRKDVISGYHCFMNAYILAKVGGFDPLKLPDGTVF